LTRVYKSNNEGTFVDIINNVNKLIEHNVFVGVNITLNNQNFKYIDPRETVEYFNKIGIKNLLVDPDIVSHIEYSAEEISSKLIDFLRYCDINNIELEGSWRTPFDLMVSENQKIIPKTFCSSRAGKNLVVSPSKGLIFCTYSTKVLSNTIENPIEAFNVFISNIKEAMKTMLPGKNNKCKGCPLEGTCMGGCMLAHDTYGDNNFMCDIYLKTTKKLIEYYYSE
jgi:radical SAM protein with 4Fe4S-binding SPASM domain